MDAVRLLKAGHAEMRDMLGHLEAPTSRAEKKRTALRGRNRGGGEGADHAHAVIDEEIFYAAFKDAAQNSGDGKMYFEELDEQCAAGDLVLPDILKTDPNSEKFSGGAKFLDELVEHHADEEEQERFPRAKRRMWKEEVTAPGKHGEVGEELLAMA